MTNPAVVVEDLHKSYGDVHALDGVSFAVEQGTVLGLLGPNGAGKTTVVRILATLLRPDSGHATVAGYDVVRDAAALRAVIGLTGQYAAVDEILTGRENLELVGRLYHLPRDEVRRRTTDLLERFELSAAADRAVRTYSGGMRRRLDLGASLIARPAVLFLDEPTSGLDPRGRIGMWEVIRDLVRDGTTLLLTTQYLEEADSLAQRIAVIDGGRVIAEGTPDELKERVGGQVIEIIVAEAAQVAAALAVIGENAFVSDASSGLIRLPVSRDGAIRLSEVVRHLDAAGVVIRDIALHRPTLDDVFLALTGRAEAEVVTPPRGRRARRAARRAEVGE